MKKPGQRRDVPRIGSSGAERGRETSSLGQDRPGKEGFAKGRWVGSGGGKEQEMPSRGRREEGGRLRSCRRRGTEAAQVSQEGTSEAQGCKDKSRAGRSKRLATARVRSSASTVGSTMKDSTGD